MPNDSPVLTHSETAQLHDLWKIAAETKLTNTRLCLKKFSAALAELLEAKNVSWLAVTHGKAPSDVFSSNLFGGWWCVDLIDFDGTADKVEATRSYLDLAKKHGPGEDTIVMLEAAGKTRVHLRQDVLTDEEHDASWKTRLYNVPILGIKERMHTAYSISPVAESYLLIDRAPNQPAFTERDRTLAYLAISGALTLHRCLFIERGLIAPATCPLSPREKDTLPLLFTEMTQKEIAAKLGVSISTTRQYINAVYRKFNVHRRSELIACCI